MKLFIFDIFHPQDTVTFRKKRLNPTYIFRIHGPSVIRYKILFNDFGEDPVYPKETIRPQPTLTVGIQINF